jgi:hypothetical protein
MHMDYQDSYMHALRLVWIVCCMHECLASIDACMHESYLGQVAACMSAALGQMHAWKLARQPPACIRAGLDKLLHA